jgi:hypothetical protein
MQAYARSGYYEIRYYSISQQMASVAAPLPANSSGTILGMGRYYNVSARITGIGNYSECAGAFCRIIEIGGDTRILVID